MASILAYLDKNNKKVSRDLFLFLVACFSSLGGVVQGFLATFLGLITSNANFLVFLSESTQGSISYLSPMKFVTPFYIGLLLGALLSYPFSDTFGRRSVLVAASAAGTMFLLWSTLSYSPADLYTSLLFVGWTIGTLVSIGPCYVSEVRCEYKSYQLMLILM